MNGLLAGLFVIAIGALIDLAIAISRCIQIISRVGEK